jgi:hypothetical protein
MNVYEVTFGNGSKLLQLATSYPECLERVQRYQMTIAAIKLIKGTDDVNVTDRVKAVLS